jgi:hypothetical protein
MAEQSGA